MPNHGDERNFRMESTWVAKEGTTPNGTKVPLGHGMTQSVCERWCASCRDWVRCAGVMGALAFDFEHEHGKE